MNTKNRLRVHGLMQFSLRSLLIVMTLVATYIAGWISHRTWNRRNLDESGLVLSFHGS